MHALRVSTVAAAFVLGAPLAHADAPEDVCFTAAVAGQKARKGGSLKEARDAFTKCAQAACPAEVTQRCTDWIAEVDDAMPSLIVAPQDSDGRDLARGVVRVDDHVYDALAGKPLSLEPGQHVVTLDVPGEARAAETLVLREHEKNRRVVLRLPKRFIQIQRPSIAPFVLGGIGLVFTASFGAFATAGTVDRQRSHCDTGCAPSDFSRVQYELVAADISLGLAAAFVTIALIDFAITRSAHKPTRAAIGPLGFVF